MRFDKDDDESGARVLDVLGKIVYFLNASVGDSNPHPSRVFVTMPL